MNIYQICRIKFEWNPNQIQKKGGVLFGKIYNDYGKYVVLLCIVASLTACMQGVTLTKDKMASIQSVCINLEIQKPGEIDFDFPQRYKPSSSNWSSILLTAAAEGFDQGLTAVALRRRYAMLGTSIDSILKEQFENELKKSNIFNSVVSSQGDAEFRFQIMSYGFIENYGGSKMQPKLWIEASLVSSDEIILWDRLVRYCHIESIHSYSRSELYGNPELMRQSLTEAARALCLYLIESMKKDLERK